ncbi:MAG: choice-of-anchor L domain-containing protein [Chitinophagaceae bacterium]
MRKLLFTFLFLTTLLNCIVSYSQITVTTGQTAAQLAQKIVGPGVTISNVTLISKATQCGEFNATANAFPFTNGIVLTSGVAKTNGSIRGINGQNQNTVVSNNLGTAGDTWLDLLLPPFLVPPVVTHDAAVLEFDLVPKGDSISFSYIFSSEEYNGFVCAKFFDVFGFKLTGFGIVGYKNIAIVPNQLSNIPVSVNSINNGTPSSGNPADFTANCQSTGIGAPFPVYYYNNNGNAYMTHRGRTVELVAKAKVTPCKTYHLKLAIADGGDGAYDSGVFLKANSLVSNPPASLSIPNSYKDSGKEVVVERCHPKEYIKINRNLKLDTTKALTLNFNYTGSAVNGVDFTAPATITIPAYKTVDSFAINVIDDGIGDDNENILIKMQQSGCSGAADSIPIKIIEYWTKTNKSNITSCYRSNTSIKNLFSDSTNTSFLWSTGDTTATIQPDSSGLYTSVATYKNSCYQKDTFTVVVDSFIVNNTVKNYSSCSPDSVALSYTTTQPAINRLWNTGSTDSIIKVNATGNYIMTCTSNNGCKAADTSFIKYIAPAIPTLPPTVNFCNGDSVLLTANNDLGLKYKWSNGDTTNAIWVKTSGKYSVTIIANGCPDVYDTTIVTAKPYPVFNLPANTTKCKGDSLWLNASTLAGSIYNWSNGLNTDSILVTTTGQYIVNVNLNGCGASDTADVLFYDVPVLTIPAVSNICTGDSVKLDATTFAGTIYTWSTGETSPIIYVKANGTYSVAATLGVCNAYDTAVLNVTQYPTLNLQTNISGCMGDSILLDATNAAGTIYIWNNGAITPTLWIKSTGTYIVNASLNGCSAIDTSFAVFNNTPILRLVATKNICAGDSFKLDATTFAGTNYSWSTGENTPTIWVKTNGSYSVKASLGVCDAYDTTVLNVTQYPTLNLQTNISGCKGDSILLDATNAVGTIYTWSNGASTPTISIKNTGTYIVNASLNGCATKDTSVAVFNNTPILNLPATKDICAGGNVTLDATTFAGTSYTWSTGEMSSQINTSISGTYFVKATLGVCDAYDTTIVTVTQYPILNLPANITSCSGDSVLLDANNAAGTIYIWSNGAITPTILVKTNGTFNVKADLNGCVSRDTATVVFNNLPIVNLPPTVGFCDGDSAILNATSNIAASQYLWNTGSISNKITVTTSGEYLVDVKANGCTTRDTTMVTVYPLPTIDAGLDLYVFGGQPVTINAIASSNVVSFAWSPSFNLSSATILQPTILNPVDTTYKIKVLTTYNCAATDFVKVTVLKDFVIPNVFSPNGDGQNDTWEIKGLENYAGLRLTIFDRYGRKVYETLGYRKSWNGNLNNYGKPLPVGTYYYIIDPKNNRPVITGSVTILR